MFVFQGSLQVRYQLSKEETHVFTIDTENFANRRLHHLKINREGRVLTIQVPYFPSSHSAKCAFGPQYNFSELRPWANCAAKFWGQVKITLSLSLWRIRIVVLRVHPPHQHQYHLGPCKKYSFLGSTSDLLNQKLFCGEGEQVMLMPVQFWYPLNCSRMRKSQGMGKGCGRRVHRWYRSMDEGTHLTWASVRVTLNNKEGRLGALTPRPVKNLSITYRWPSLSSVPLYPQFPICGFNQWRIP